MWPVPILRILTPAQKPATPDGFTQIDTPVTQGLPHFIPLRGELQLAVLVSTGVIRQWIDSDPSTVISQSLAETQAANAADDEPLGALTQPAARLVLLDRGSPVGAAGLIAGRRILLPESGARPAQVEVIVLEWDLRAGSLRGPGDFGSRITLAWRAADVAVAHFSTPPVNPVLVKRLPPEFRIESRLGLLREIKLRRFLQKKVVR